MESLRGLPEHIEADFGDSIVARDEAVAVLGSTPGLGPPDLCWLQKSPKKTGFFSGSGEAQGYYHFVLGRDVASSAAIAAYFALLNSKVEHRTVLQGLWMSPDFSIERGFYCVYDPIGRMDVRCELCVPGGVVVGCVDAAGQLHEATPQVWQQAQVSAFMRAVLFEPEMRLNGGAIMAYDPCATDTSEAGLLSSVLGLYRSGVLPGALEHIAEQQGYGVAAEHMDLVLAALWQHFRRRQRWAAAADFFRELVQVHAPAVLLLAAADRAQGLGTGAGNATLSELLSRPAGGLHLDSWQALVPSTMVGLGHELLAKGEADAAASLARRALLVCPRCRPAWLLLAQCFVAERQFAAALVALNVVPTPPMPAAEAELLHVVPPPPPKATTQPQVRLYDGELEAARCSALEEASLDGNRLLAYLPGSILVNKEPLGASLQPDVGPNRITRSVLTAVYGLLQAIVREVSWDKFLEVRSSVFLMQHEVAQSPLATSSSQHPDRASSEIQPQAASPAQDLAALQKAQQAALMRRLEQLGLVGDTASSTPGTAGTRPLHSSPLPTSGDTPVVLPAAAPPGATGTGGSTTATPPASRGKLSSAGGARPRSGGGGGSPQSYYANRLQEKLSRPRVTPSSHASSSGGGAVASTAPGAPVTPTPPTSQPPASVPEQQQQHPVLTGTQDLPRPHVQGLPGAGQRSMAGRVLLLGKKTQARSSDSSRPPSARPVTPVGCGVPRTLSPNEVEDLSKYTTASKVAPLRVPAGAPAAGVMPELWQAVFGAGASSVVQPGPAGGDMRRTHHSSSVDSDDDLAAAAAGLPRIRTRPLGEQVEQQDHLLYGAGSATAAPYQQQQQQQHTALPGIWPAGGRYSRSLHRSFLGGASSGDSAIRSSSSDVLALYSWGWWQGFSPGMKRSASCCQQAQQPLGEGLDRTASLLTRSISNASAGAAGTSVGLAQAGSLQRGTSGLHRAGSHTLSATRPGRLSLVGEAANRSLDADREGLAKGWVHDDTTAQAGWGGGEGHASPRSGGRRLCVRWLDELIVALWHDLQAHMEWKVVDQTLRETRGGTAAELVLGMAPSTISGSPTSQAAAQSSAATTPRAPGTSGVNSGGAFQAPVLTCADWLRRGALAERLGHTLDARSAYRASVKLSFNLTAYLALMRLEAQAESISNTALCSMHILEWHQQRVGQVTAQGPSSSSVQAAAGVATGGLVLLGVPPLDVTWALGLVMDSTSPDEVRRVVSDVPASAAQRMVLGVIDEWQRWQGLRRMQSLQALK